MVIDFTLSPEQLQLQANARAFAEGVLAPIAAQLDAIADPGEAFYSTRAAFREMAKAGFTKSFIPVADGGLGFGLVDFAIAAEELAHVDVNVPTNGTGWDGKGAHLYSVVCRTDPTKGARESLAVVMVPGNAAGVQVIDVYDKLGHRGVMTPRVHFDGVRVPADHLIGRPGQGLEIVSGAFSWTAALIGSACVGFMLADIKMRIEAARYLTWKACHYLEQTGGRGEELAIMTKVYCSELAVQVVYDAMRLVGVESYTKKTPLERLLRNALVFPLYDGGNMGVRRRQLHALFTQPGYDSMLAAQGLIPPWKEE